MLISKRLQNNVQALIMPGGLNTLTRQTGREGTLIKKITNKKL
jgi:hypothetical protein